MTEAQAQDKYAVLLMAPESTPDGRGRLIHAFTTAGDLLAAGHQVEFYFEGIGVECLTAFHEKSNPFSAHYIKLLAPILSIAKTCATCTRHFKAEAGAAALGVELTGGEDRHHSQARLLVEGYRVLVF